MSDGGHPLPSGFAMPTALVTGVSSGIGASIARQLVDKGWFVFGSLRQKADRKRIVKEFERHFIPVLFDVTDAREIAAAAGLIGAHLGPHRLDALVNNAGVVVAGPSLELDSDAYRRQFEINLFGQIELTRAMLPLLARPQREPHARSSRIVNIGSVSGRIALPFLAPYAASKHALEAWSDSLRRELMLAGYGIDVSVIAPGPVRTPIWDKAAANDIARYRHTPYADSVAAFAALAAREADNGLPAEQVARVVLKALTVRHPRPRYRVERHPMLGALLPQLPKRLFDRLVVGRLGGKA